MDVKNARAYLAFHGRELCEGGLEAIVGMCLAKSARKLELITEADLSSAEITAIRESYIQDMELPEGYFFDGQSFVDQYGNSSRFHPHHDQFVQDYIGLAQPLRSLTLSSEN